MKKYNLNDLAQKLCREDKGKDEMSIAQMKRAIGLLAENLFAEGGALYIKLYQLGERRAKKRKKRDS